MAKLVKAALLIVTVAFMAIIMASCGGETLYVFTWGDYLDAQVVKDFEKEYCIKVKVDTYDSNEALYTTLTKKNSKYDLLFPSDYMIERLINEGLLEKLNMDNIPNYKNIDDLFKNLDCDPNNEYMVSYMWGTVGLLYNKARTGGDLDSWGALWDEKYKDRIYMYDSVRDTIGLTIMLLGYNPDAATAAGMYGNMNTTNPADVRAARDKLIEQKPLKPVYAGDTIRGFMVTNEKDVAVVYSGDAILCKAENPNLEYVIPKEGSNVWFDGIVIPKAAKHKESAELFIDYLCRPEVAAYLSEEIGYTTANRAALDYMDEDVTSDPIFWPTDEELARCQIFKDLGSFISEYNDAWNEITMALSQ